MSKRALSLLNELGLLHNNMPGDLSEISDEALTDKLHSYFEERTKNVNSDIHKVDEGRDLSCLVSSFSARNSQKTILSSSLIHKHLIADDPIYKLSAPETDIGKTHREYIGVKSNEILDRVSIKQALSYFSDLTPLIKAELIAVVPLHILHMPEEQTPIYYSEDRFRSEIPDNIHDFIHQSAYVKPLILKRDTGDLIVLQVNAKEPCRGIQIGFKNDFCASGESFYLYHEAVPEQIDHDTRIVRFRMSWEPDKPMDKDTFEAWVYQSINRTIIARLRSITSESRLAVSLGHSYLTESAFEADLLRQSGFRGEDTSSNSINFLTALESLIEIPSAEAVVRLRESNETSFDRFRASLLDIGEQLSGVPDHEFQIKAERLFWTEVQPQVDEIKKSVRRIQVSGVKGGLVALGGIAITVATGTAVPLVAAGLYAGSGALTEVLPSVSEYMSKRSRPEYVWAKLAK
jgi:hypothetical protein